MKREFLTEEREGATHYRIAQEGVPLSFRTLFESLRDNDSFAAFYDAELGATQFPAAFWEHPPLTTTTLDALAEFVLVPADALAASVADPSPFANRWRAKPPESVTRFENIGGDAVLIVPTPGGHDAAYTHLLSFVRGAPAPQRRAFWREVGAAVLENVGDTPMWLSTAGLGVSWLHVRLDRRPKYYRHGPYRRFP